MAHDVQYLTNQFGQLWSKAQDDLLKTRNWCPAVIEGRDGHWSGVDHRISLSFTIASYNVLSQTLLEEHSFLYKHVDPRFLTWNHRKQKLIHELSHYQPDIICLQEVEERHYDEFFRHELQTRGYEGVYKKRSNDKVDGCATFYKYDKFFCEKVVDVDYYRTDLGLDRDNIGLLLLLSAQNKRQYRGKLCIANTHLLYNPRRGDIKLAQLMLLLAKIDEVARLPMSGSNQYHPVILCGDLNLEPDSDLYLFLCRGHLQYEGLLQHEMSGQLRDFHGKWFPMQANLFGLQQALTHECQFIDVLRKQYFSCPSIGPAGYVTHKLNLISAYSHYSSHGSKHELKEATSVHENEPVTVDYILYSVAAKKSYFRKGHMQMSDVEEGSLSLIRILELLTDRDFEALGNLPTRNTASDHLILLAEFCLHN